MDFQLPASTFPRGLDRLSPEMERAFTAACIKETDPHDHPLAVRRIGNETNWVIHPAMMASWAFIDKNFSGRMRKYGKPVSEASHIIWAGHRNANIEGLRRALKQENIDPVLAAFLAVHHDSLETLRDNAKRDGIAFDMKQAQDEILQLWPHEKDYPIIGAVDFDYMTDADDNLHGDARIRAQKEKRAKYPGASSLIRHLNIETAASDKGHHALSDSLQRTRYILFRAPDDLTLKDKRLYGLPDEDIAKAAHQADIKSFVFDHPGIIAKEDRDRYRRASKFLITQGQIVGLMGKLPAAAPVRAEIKKKMKSNVVFLRAALAAG
ncbi:MAG: hypothetical protein KGI97_06195 [Alphaproteobacteria bacterium]|nr:hypothetical protein [Alphaproteobacteria bacterium]